MKREGIRYFEILQRSEQHAVTGKQLCVLVCGFASVIELRNREIQTHSERRSIDDIVIEHSVTVDVDLVQAIHDEVAWNAMPLS